MIYNLIDYFLARTAGGFNDFWNSCFTAEQAVSFKRGNEREDNVSLNRGRCALYSRKFRRAYVRLLFTESYKSLDLREVCVLNSDSTQFIGGFSIYADIKLFSENFLKFD